MSEVAQTQTKREESENLLPILPYDPCLLNKDQQFKPLLNSIYRSIYRSN